MIYDRLLPLMQQVSQSRAKTIDILPILQSYTIDFTAAFVFGLSRGTNFMMDATARDIWLEAYIQSYPSDSMFWLQECPRVTKWLRAVGLGGLVLPPGHDAARQTLDDWTVEKLRLAENALYFNGNNQDTFEPGQFPTLYSTVKSGLAKSCGLDESFTPDSKQELELASECFDHVRKFSYLPVYSRFI